MRSEEVGGVLNTRYLCVTADTASLPVDLQHVMFKLGVVCKFIPTLSTSVPRMEEVVMLCFLRPGVEEGITALAVQLVMLHNFVHCILVLAMRFLET